MFLKTLITKSRDTTFKVRAEFMFEEKLLLCFREKHFNRSLIIQRQSQERILERGKSEREGDAKELCIIK